MKKLKRFFGVLIIAPLDFIQKYFKTFVFLFIVLLVLGAGGESKDGAANLAKIYLKGPIFESESFARQVENLKKYPNLRGVLLVIDSPGGSLASSVEIADTIKELGEGLPIVAFAQGAMASGSYYAGMYAHTIVANRGAMIGSIGVIFNGYNIADLMGRLGIQSQSLKAGEFKEAGTFAREWSENEKTYLQNLLNKQYAMFVGDVAAARRLNPSDYKNFAEGKIFSAFEAANLGLIDLVGSQTNAINILKELSGVKEAVWAKQGLLEGYAERLVNSAVVAFYNLAKVR